MAVTNDEIRAMADELESQKVWLSKGDVFPNGVNEAPFKAAAMLRSILAERENEFICGRCGKRFDGPKQEIDW